MKKKPSVSIAEIILATQESQADSSFSFIQVAYNIYSVINKVRIKMSKTKYTIGDIVYLKSIVTDINWKLNKFLDSPFVIIAMPIATEKFKTYTLRLLDDPFDKDCWVDYHYHEDFFYKRDTNA